MSAVLAVALSGVLAMTSLALATDAPASPERPESGAVIHRLGAAPVAPPARPALATTTASPSVASAATTSPERLHEILTTLETRINGQARDLAEMKTYLAAMLQVLELLRLEFATGATVARGGALPTVPKAPDTAAAFKTSAPGILKIPPVVIPAPAPGGGG